MIITAFELPKLDYAYDALEPYIRCKNNGNTPHKTPCCLYR
ncbi:MAG: hypothetical protein HC906_00995 [Bacteroidales bacterium]|nr:hypothetical protein [Bacteroidales bacterium]